MSGTSKKKARKKALKVGSMEIVRQQSEEIKRLIKKINKLKSYIKYLNDSVNRILEAKRQKYQQLSAKHEKAITTLKTLRCHSSDAFQELKNELAAYQRSLLLVQKEGQKAEERMKIGISHFSEETHSGGTGATMKFEGESGTLVPDECGISRIESLVDADEFLTHSERLKGCMAGSESSIDAAIAAIRKLKSSMSSSSKSESLSDAMKSVYGDYVDDYYYDHDVSYMHPVGNVYGSNVYGLHSNDLMMIDGALLAILVVLSAVFLFCIVCLCGFAFIRYYTKNKTVRDSVIYENVSNHLENI